jgi:hypothetical protein
MMAQRNTQLDKAESTRLRWFSSALGICSCVYSHSQVCLLRLSLLTLAFLWDGLALHVRRP